MFCYFLTWENCRAKDDVALTCGIQSGVEPHAGQRAPMLFQWNFESHTPGWSGGILVFYDRPDFFQRFFVDQNFFGPDSCFSRGKFGHGYGNLFRFGNF